MTSSISPDEWAVAEAIAVSLFGHPVGPSAIVPQIPEARAAIAAMKQRHPSSEGACAGCGHESTDLYCGWCHNA